MSDHVKTAQSEGVRRYFDISAERFDLIYEDKKGYSQKVVDRLFRGVIHDRFALTLELCGDLEGKRALDVGCGSGRYPVEFARQGAETVGLDFAPAMVDMARQAAAAAGVADRCDFAAVDFMHWTPPHPFDICLAIGFFDYIAQPEPFLEKMCQTTTEKAVFSFPVRWTMRTMTRWMRLRLNRCPVYFYDEDQIRQLLDQAGWKTAAVHRLSRDYLVEAHPGV